MNIVEGTYFRNVHMPRHGFTIKKVDKENNKLSVLIEKDGDPNSYWQEDDWNLAHTEAGFERGEYFVISVPGS